MKTESHQPEELPLGAAVKQRVKEWLLDTDIHGLPNIARSDKLLIQIIWAVCFCASTATCSFLVFRSINGYLEFGVFSKFDMIFETPCVFPTVSVCSQNIFITENATAYVKRIMDKNNITFESLADTSDMLWYKSPGLKLKQSLSNAKFLAIINTEYENDTVAFRKALSLSLSEFMISCEFGSVECADDDFEWYFDSIFGSCFSYGKKSLKMTNRAGNWDGLIMQLAHGLGDPEDNYTLSIRGGVHIFIHNQTIQPTSYEGYDVAPGTSTSFVVKRQFSDKLPFPYNDCYDNLNTVDAYDSVLFQAIIKANLTYRQIDCFWQCYQKQAVETCLCYDLSFPPLFGGQACHTVDQLDCLNTVYQAFTVDDTCRSLCPLQCDNYDLSVLTHFTNFPSQTYARLMSTLPTVQARFPGQTVTYEMLKASFAEVKVYYEQTSYQLIEESESLSLIDLISSLGGTLGLFLGVSFLSFIELVEVTLEILLLFCAHLKSSTRKKTSEVVPFKN